MSLGSFLAHALRGLSVIAALIAAGALTGANPVGAGQRGEVLVAVATPSPRSTDEPSPSPDASLEPTALPSAAPSATPIPEGFVGPMELEVTNCHGGVVLRWSIVSDPRFSHYTTLRGPSPDIALQYPPNQSFVVDWGGSYTTDPYVTTAVDAALADGQVAHYRTLALDASDQVIGASDTAQVVGVPVYPLGSLTASPDGSGTRLGWTSYPGSVACFTNYKVVVSETDATPSWTDGATAMTVLTDQYASVYITQALQPGTAYHLRIQAFRATTLGEPFLVAESDPLTYTVPVPTPRPSPTPSSAPIS